MVENIVNFYRLCKNILTFYPFVGEVLNLKKHTYYLFISFIYTYIIIPLLNSFFFALQIYLFKTVYVFFTDLLLLVSKVR